MDWKSKQGGAAALTVPERDLAQREYNAKRGRNHPKAMDSFEAFVAWAQEKAARTAAKAEEGAPADAATCDDGRGWRERNGVDDMSEAELAAAEISFNAKRANGHAKAQGTLEEYIRWSQEKHARKAAKAEGGALEPASARASGKVQVPGRAEHAETASNGYGGGVITDAAERRALVDSLMEPLTVLPPAPKPDWEEPNGAVLF